MTSRASVVGIVATISKLRFVFICDAGLIPNGLLGSVVVGIIGCKEGERGSSDGGGGGESSS